MIIDSIQNGIVIDHISAGKAMELYRILGLDKLDCTVAILKNVTSGKLGRKDIIKIDREMELELGSHRLRGPQHHRQQYPGRPVGGKAHPEAAGAHPWCAALQESPVHHLRGAGAAPGVRAHRPGKAVYRCIYARRRRKNKWYARKPTVAPWAFLRSPPISRFPLHILSAAQRFAPVLFYYNFVYII